MNYDAWNDALGRWFFNPSKRDEDVYLSVDPTTLLRAARNAATPGSFEDTEAAVADFTAALRLQTSKPPCYGWICAPTPSEGHPPYLALLGAQVLAVHQMMHEEDQWTVSALWPRVRRLLGQFEERKMPLGLDRGLQQTLWRDGLQRWSNVTLGGRWGRLVLPEGDEGHRHIRLPKSQALLRLEDVQHLHRFFTAAGLQPGESLSSETLRRYLLPFATVAAVFSLHARNVLSDKGRVLAVCEQIADCLQTWDGSTDIQGNAASRTARRLWLGVQEAPSPALRGGLLENPASTSPTRLSYSLDQLLVSPNGSPWRPLRPDAVLTVWDPTTDYYVERRVALPGDSVLLVVRAYAASDLETTAPEIAENRVLAFDHVARWKTQDTRWRVLVFSINEDLESTPRCWEPYVIIPESRIVPRDGLRLTRRTWMTGAGPRLQVVGTKTHAALWIDGERHDLVDGSVRSTQLDEPGVHSAWLPNSRRLPVRIVVQDPLVATSSAPRLWAWGGISTWPQNRVATTDSWICGPQVEGLWPRARIQVAVEKVAIRLALSLLCGPLTALHNYGPVPAEACQHNPLLKALHTAAGASGTRFQPGGDIR